MKTPFETSVEISFLLKTISAIPQEVEASVALSEKKLLSCAEEHKLTAFLWNAIQNTPKILSSTNRELLKREYAEQVKKNLFLSARLLETLRTFKRNKIDVLPIKGPVLASQLYPQPHLRSFVDLDLMIRKCDYADTRDLLQGLGFQSREDLNGCREKLRLNANCEVEFLHKEEPVLIDLHWEIVPPAFAIVYQKERLWKEAQKCAFQRQQMTVVGDTDLALLICLNGFKSGWFNLRDILDLSQFVKKYPHFDWVSFMKVSKRKGCHAIVLVGLALSEALLKTPLPEVVLSENQKRPNLSRVKDFILEHLLTNALISHRDLKFAQMQMLPLRKKIFYFFHSKVTPSDWDAQSLLLPNRLYFLYYFIRPFRLIFKKLFSS